MYERVFKQKDRREKFTISDIKGDHGMGVCWSVWPKPNKNGLRHFESIVIVAVDVIVIVTSYTF